MSLKRDKARGENHGEVGEGLDTGSLEIPKHKQHLQVYGMTNYFTLDLHLVINAFIQSDLQVMYKARDLNSGLQHGGLHLSTKLSSC